jgi:hypothetical protein
MISLCDRIRAGRLWGQVGIDRPDDTDVPPDRQSDHLAERPDVADHDSRRTHRTGNEQVELRDRQEYDADLRAEVSAEQRTKATEAIRPDGRSASGEWDGTAERSRGSWADHEHKWPVEERPPVDRSGDPPGSWRGESNRFLDSGVNGQVDERCDRIAETERDIVSPGMRAVESRDQDRHLIGFEYRLKGRDRIKDKVAEQMEAQPDLTANQAIKTVKDAVRYTFCYGQERYEVGVRADIDNMAAQGFQEIERRNSWKEDQYKGINSRWREPGAGLIFEVQFHTRSSFEAKQITHRAYERLRDPRTSPAEQRELEDFQRYLCTNIPIPPGATEIPGYP